MPRYLVTCRECGAREGYHQLRCLTYLAWVHRHNPQAHRRIRKIKRRSTMRKVLAALGLAAVLATTATSVQAATAEPQPPYGGCGEAIDYPRSDGADWCRDHGFTVTRRIVVSPYGYVLSYRMPKCSVEDASAGPVPCRWNFGNGQTGNGHGKAYWVSRNGMTHYVKGMATAD